MENKDIPSFYEMQIIYFTQDVFVVIADRREAESTVSSQEADEGC